MSLRAFEQGSNIIAYERSGKRYGMTCAWATMIDYSSIGMLLGSQSVTGNNLRVGDIVGVSALALGQEDIALAFGDYHSDELDKFKGIKYTNKNNALLIEGTKVKMVCTVKSINHLLDNDDNFIVLEVNTYDADKSKKFMPLEDVLPEK